MKHYRDKDVTDPHFSRNQILDKLLSTARNSKRHPIPHYRKKYKSVPPWVLFTDTYLGTLVNFTKFLKGSERDALVSLLYGSDTTHEQMELLKGLLHDTAFICYDYRNRAAHGSIMYGAMTITKKFHNTPHCSGMKNPSKVNILKVEELGLKPCRKCCVTEP